MLQHTPLLYHVSSYLLDTALAPLLFCCVKTVFERHVFEALGLLFERKQVPQIVVNVNS